MSYQKQRCGVSIPKEYHATVDSLTTIISAALQELSRIKSQTLQKSEAQDPKQKKEVSYKFTLDSLEVTYDDGSQDCTDHKNKVCCEGPCPCE